MLTITPSVGDVMSAAISAAGQRILCIGGRVACETDYLAACGAEFPKGIPLAELEEFNRRTYFADMDEHAEHRRYAAIAGFFRRHRHAV